MSSATHRLKALMQAANLPSYRALASQAAVSRWQIQQLRNGHLDTMRVAPLRQIAAALNIDLLQLLQTFAVDHADETADQPGSQLASGCSQETGRRASEAQLQSEALQTLETWLIQWPTIAQRVQENPTLAASKLLPFIRPVEQLMREWGVVPIATVDDQIAYDPQYHQLIKGTASPGEPVQVTHPGSLWNGKLLHRARVKPVLPSSPGEGENG